MASIISNKWNFAVAFLSMNFGKILLAKGSGFFWTYEAKTFLVTNWHNLAGRDPTSKQPLSPHGGVPDNIEFLGYAPASVKDIDGNQLMSIQGVKVPLTVYQSGIPAWYQHPVHGSAIDIAALDVTDYVGELILNRVNEVEDDADIEPYASQEAFIVGYPLGLVARAPVPVWKRATIATDPAFEPDGKPVIYVDTASRKGMSGSVVIVRHTTVGRSFKRKNGILSEPMFHAVNDIVLGVYSGRLGARVCRQSVICGIPVGA